MFRRPTRRLLAVALVGALAVPPGAASASERPPGTWHGAWGAAPHHPVPGNEWDGPNWSLDGFAAQSVRQVVRISAGGSRVRIRLSNAYGTSPLRVTGATVAESGGGAALRPGTLRTLRFGHRAATVVPAGGSTASDPAALPVAPLESLTVTLYFAGPTGPATFHEGGLTTTYRAAGDHLSDTGPGAFAGETSHSRYFLTGVDVAGTAPPLRGTVVAFGDSITDGYGSTPDTDRRYPDRLAERLTSSGRRLTVVNAGINGNKLLADSPCYGEKGLGRFRRDALDRPGVRTVIVLEGLNDIGGGGFPDFGCGASPKVTARQVIDAHRTLIRAAHARGVRIVGATITPMKGAQGYDTPANERIRDAVNHWIRTSGAYDAVADFDRALADPRVPDALRPAFDSGDHLHPNDAGAAALAAAIDLTTL
ncbi:SGNH/GDSL hydrolase family protein [Actinomadura decatromicini]|uniref:SGNH/GDSL hydrolase family protein n=1 Tax=Actinomadura decatromicini TaxID=2604572 RepID=A0A5D3FXK3_9ACTN|nr:SGNH/GDSL hydrolase family protein [Actinomadura decatromicini]TYK52636.1 SGNH/GDSL hydrolase family protein [Actinomadura decatromicini]